MTIDERLDGQTFDGNIFNAGTITSAGTNVEGSTISGRITDAGTLIGGLSIDSSSKILASQTAIKVHQDAGPRCRRDQTRIGDAAGEGDGVCRRSAAAGRGGAAAAQAEARIIARGEGLVDRVRIARRRSA